MTLIYEVLLRNTPTVKEYISSFVLSQHIKSDQAFIPNKYHRVIMKHIFFCSILFSVNLVKLKIG